jgi:RNA polymerase sigma-70 factor (ECF subfamily)
VGQQSGTNSHSPRQETLISSYLPGFHCGTTLALARFEKEPQDRFTMARPANTRCKVPELELIAAARNGDEDAMAELFRRQYPYSIAMARRMLPAQEEYLDAVQSAYLSAFRNFQSFRAEATFKTWITRIVLNQCLMHLREPGLRRITLSLDQSDHGDAMPVTAAHSPTPEDLALRAELNRAVADAAAVLPKRLNDVFTRCTISGLSIQDTAQALGLTVQATKTRLFRARCLVRQKLQAFRDGITPATSRIAFR